MNFIFVTADTPDEFERALHTAAAAFRINQDLEIQYATTAVQRGSYDVAREYTALVIGRPQTYERTSSSA